MVGWADACLAARRLASAICAQFWGEWGAARPRFVTVEPLLAACCQHSAREGQTPETLEAMSPAEHATIQVGLDCRVPASLAWEVLQTGTNDFAAIGDEAVDPCMAVLRGLEPPLLAGRSGVAGLGLLMAAAANPELRAQLGIDAESRVAVIVCESDVGH